LVGPVSAAIGERMKDIKMVIYLSTSLPPQAFICPKGAIPLFQNSNIPITERSVAMFQIPNSKEHGTTALIKIHNPMNLPPHFPSSQLPSLPHPPF
jgi:hypothetical protein